MVTQDEVLLLLGNESARCIVFGCGHRHLHGLGGPAEGPRPRSSCFGGFANIISIDFFTGARAIVFHSSLGYDQKEKAVVVYWGHIEWTVFVSCCFLYFFLFCFF